MWAEELPARGAALPFLDLFRAPFFLAPFFWEHFPGEAFFFPPAASTWTKGESGEAEEPGNAGEEMTDTTKKPRMARKTVSTRVIKPTLLFLMPCRNEILPQHGANFQVQMVVPLNESWREFPLHGNFQPGPWFLSVSLTNGLPSGWILWKNISYFQRFANMGWLNKVPVTNTVLLAING
jgi:hypothetical protein